MTLQAGHFYLLKSIVSFFFPQKQQEAIIKFKYAAYDRGESSVTSGIITMESEMKNIEKTNI